MGNLLKRIRDAYTNSRCLVCGIDMREAGITPVGKLGACSEEHAHELDVATTY